MSTDKLRPMLFDCIRGYSVGKFFKDLIAGIIVAIIALPLSIALALASGVGPEEGIYTAIVAGFLISFFGGSQVQIAGPTAAFATIVAGIVARNGMDGLVVATLIAGVMLILMGIFRIGSLIKYIPYTITTGFTAGIAVTIAIGQLKDFFGLTYAAGVKPVETIEKLMAVIENFGTVTWWAVLVGVICVLIQIFWPKINQRIPGSLIAVIAGIAIVKLGHLDVKTIGDLYTINSGLPSFHFPQLSMNLIRLEFSDGFTIAILAAIESLLSCVVADGMINSKHRSDQELIAQGIGNIGSVLFGGIPATGAIARTAANIKNGGQTPVSGMIHALMLVLVLVLAMPYAALIPMPTIAAILFIVAYNMSGWRNCLMLLKKAPKSDITVLVATFVLTVVFDLVIAIKFGMLAACILFMKRMADEAKIRGWEYHGDSAEDPDRTESRNIPYYIRVYEVTGPLFFGASERIGNITLKVFTEVVIIRMRGVPAIDITALIALEHLLDVYEREGIKIIFSHVNEQPMKMFEHAKFVERIGRENFAINFDAALARAVEIHKENDAD